VRGDTVIRALQMIQLLRGRRRSLDEFAGQFKVSTRTVRRDLEVLSIAGVQVRSTKDATANGLAAFWWVEP
jgi:predicted DNA-binding transcriptional regulator YafY